MQMIQADRGQAQVENSKAIAEVQAAIMIARQYPRDQEQAANNILVNCKRKSLAGVAEYSYTRGGEEISGPSVKLMTAIAAAWGNIDFGVKEVAREQGHDGVGVSECVAYALDLESNARRTIGFTVRHWRDTKQGGYPLKSDRDIQEMILNQGSRRMRACLEAIIPGWVVEECREACQQTMLADTVKDGQTVEEVFARAVKAFQERDERVTEDHINGFLQRKGGSAKPTPAAIQKLRSLLRAVEDGYTTLDEQLDLPAKGAAKQEVKQDHATEAALGERPVKKTSTVNGILKTISVLESVDDVGKMAEALTSGSIEAAPGMKFSDLSEQDRGRISEALASREEALMTPSKEEKPKGKK